MAFSLSTSAKANLTANYADLFDVTYERHPIIPNGLLEAVAFAQTRIQHITGNNHGCLGLPQVKGVMGLTKDGEGYFRNNLDFVARLSEIDRNDIIENPADNIEAYAIAYEKLMRRTRTATIDFRGHDQLLKTLSEIPWHKNNASDYALSSFTYEVFRFLMTERYQTLFEFPSYEIDLLSIYGEQNLDMLRSQKILVSTEAVIGEDGREFESMDRTDEYGPALWEATPACNYSSRSGTPISAVTIHTIQGSYAGAISWAQNCATNVSYHYVVRSSDGQVTQMLLEADKGWHVGSENPYTIGIEHEGYVDDPVWYTEALYTSSVDLVRDITESGYGINPLRTYHGVATAGVLTIGACTKIKGHQHFPGASHTDPGIHWDWEHYYQLINDDPAVYEYTASTGTLFDSGGAAEDYENDERFLYLIAPDGASTVTLSVISFDLELDWDYLRIYDGDNLDAPLIGTYTGTDIDDIITSSGGSISLEFRSDCGITRPGWEINWSSTIGDGIGDEIAPTTEVLVDATWYTEDFEAFFEDEDDSLGSGIHKQYIQVIDYDGVEWRANADRGYFSDNFDLVIHPEWISVSGDWDIFDEVLRQSNEDNGNTNIYADVNQNDYDRYLYHWAGKMSGVGDNKRAGLHFMCDDATLTNRGNSYFVWFREDDNKLQVYKVTDDVFECVEDLEYAFSPDLWYDFKTTYDKETGEIDVWINNVHELSWIDAEPITTGDAVSFRSGNSTYYINNFKIYHSRSEAETVLVGPAGDARYQNPDPFTPACKVKSIVVDSTKNVSTIGSDLIDVDWTPPVAIDWVNDGLADDIATTTSNTELTANWANSFDTHSGLARYWYAIGTTPGDSNIVSWTDNWYADTVVHDGLELTFGETYYFSICAENGAGLLSDTVFSDGQLLIEPTEPPVADFITENTNLCGADSVLLENSSMDAVSYEWFIPDGTPSYSTAVNPYVTFPLTGIYPVTLVATGPGGEDTLILSVAVNIDAAPIALFEPSATIVPIEDATITFDNSSLNADGYYWSFGDGEFSADEDPWHEYTALGTFEVALIAINGDCPNDTAHASILVTDTYGIDQFQPSDVEVYPNPAKDWVFLKSIHSLNQFQFKIYDATGRSVYIGSGIKTDKGYQIPVHDLSSGVYQLEISDGNGSLVKQLVIE